uniref:Adipocyte plasma membrane-associated protein n=1 Tax=Parascaris equorum TaxID=6256 RepID=A0A914R0Q8_PAREQ
MGRIERAWLDGTHRVILVRIVLEEDAWPNGIAIDPEQDRIFWAEGRRSLIKSAVLRDGSDVTVFSSSVNHPYSLSKLGNTLYCNSLYGRKISAIRIPPQNETLFGERLAVISDSVIYGQMGIRAVSLNHVPHDRMDREDVCVRISYALSIFGKTGVLAGSSRQRLFWVAEGRGRFTRANLRSAFFNGSDVRTVLESVSINHLSIDWITGNIYWLVFERRHLKTFHSLIFIS